MEKEPFLIGYSPHGSMFNYCFIHDFFVICMINIGRSQVLIGVTPLETSYLSNQSCKAVCPLAIANCKEDRYIV